MKYITYHHIGGRNGTYPFPIKNSSLLKDFHLVLYDADAVCKIQMEEAQKNSLNRTSIFPYCISETSKLGHFKINFHPTTSSILEFNERYEDYSFISNPIYGEYRLGDACKLVRQIELPFYSISDAMKNSGITELDMLSLDIQGSEYDVIYGSKDLIKNKCLLLHLEAEFITIYKGQKTFFEIHDLMTNLGFELIDLSSINRSSPITLPIGMRGSERPMYAEAVYLKKLESLNDKTNVFELCKYAFFAFIYSNIGYGIQALKKIATQMDLTFISEEDPEHIVFLKKIWDAYCNANYLLSPKLSELFTEKIFENFYSNTTDEIFPYIEQLPKKMIENIRLKYLPLINEVRDLENLDQTNFEKVFHDYGLIDLEKTIKAQRKKEAQNFQTLLVPFIEKSLENVTV